MTYQIIINGVKQVCVQAPILFSIFFHMMLKHATDDLYDEDWLYVRYRLDGSLFNLLKYHLVWTGHVSRIKKHRLQKIDLYRKLSTGHRKRSPDETLQIQFQKSPPLHAMFTTYAGLTLQRTVVPAPLDRQ